MGYLLSVLSAIFFGLNPSVIVKIKTKPYQQAFYTILGLFIFSICIFFITFNDSISDLNTPLIGQIIFFSAFSGLCYAFAQILQYKTIELLGAGKGFAFSTASILVFNALFSLMLFNEWTNLNEYLLGFSSLLIIIVGAFVLALKDKSKCVQIEESIEEKKKSKKKFIYGIFIVVLQGIIFGGNLLSPQLILKENTFTIFNLGPFYIENLHPTSILIFQASGALITISLLIFIKFLINRSKKNEEKINNCEEKEEKTLLFNKRFFLALIPGIIYSFGNICLVYSNTMINSSIANSLTQICCAFSIIFSFIILKEYKGKTKKELLYMISGSLLVAIGGVMIGFTSLV